MSKKKSLLLIGVISLIIILVICFSLFKTYTDTIDINDTKYTILSKSESPDNTYTAYILLYNGGITTDWQVYVALTNNSSFTNRATIVFGVNHAKELKSRWDDSSNLTILHNSNEQDILTNFSSFKDITINLETDTKIQQIR